VKIFYLLVLLVSGFTTFDFSGFLVFFYQVSGFLSCLLSGFLVIYNLAFWFTSYFAFWFSSHLASWLPSYLAFWFVCYLAIRVSGLPDKMLSGLTVNWCIPPHLLNGQSSPKGLGTLLERSKTRKPNRR
jgi:hypothetical protein